LSDIRALTFDVFGTTVDWRAGVAAEAQRLGALSGVQGDWERLADAWRALYVPSMNRVRNGELPWTNFDRLHRLSLDQVLGDLGIDCGDRAQRDELTLEWERLPPWPDSAEGEGRQKFDQDRAHGGAPCPNMLPRRRWAFS
jgi:2-haloacid dehalogenase